MGFKISTEIVSVNNLDIYTKDRFIKFDYDKINKGLYIRNRKAGDRFVSHGMKGNKIKDYFIDEKVPKEKESHSNFSR